MRIAGPRREAFSSRLRPARTERGSVAVSVILIPLAFLAVFSTIQLAMVVHGRNVVTAAVEEALFTTAQHGADRDDGEQIANEILGFYKAVEVDDIDIAKGDEIVTVRITGEISTPLSFFSDFDIGLSGPVEKFYAESERQ